MLLLFMRAGAWMDDAQAAALLAFLDSQKFATADDRARLALCAAQLHVHRSAWDDALEGLQTGLSLEGELGGISVKFGVAPMLCVLLAHVRMRRGELAAAGAAAERLQAYPSGYTLYRAAHFKMAQVQKQLGVATAAAYTPLHLRAGRVGRMRLPLQPGESVEWEWLVESRGVDFTVSFEPSAPTASGAPATVQVVPTYHHDASGGPAEGRYERQADASPGVLELCWSNYGSYMLSRSVAYRVVHHGPCGEALPGAAEVVVQ
eukprot:3661951-Prymnesium_polylepis.1